MSQVSDGSGRGGRKLRARFFFYPSIERRLVSNCFFNKDYVLKSVSNAPVIEWYTRRLGALLPGVSLSWDRGKEWFSDDDSLAERHRGNFEKSHYPTVVQVGGGALVHRSFACSVCLCVRRMILLRERRSTKRL